MPQTHSYWKKGTGVAVREKDTRKGGIGGVVSRRDLPPRKQAEQGHNAASDK